MIAKYTKERWLKLCEITATLSALDTHIDAMELRLMFDSKEDWEFAISRLLSLGLVYWNDLSPTEKEIAQSAYLAARREGASPEAIASEIELLYAPMKCVAGAPLRSLPDRPDHDLGWHDKAGQVEFGAEGFVWSDGNVVFQAPESLGVVFKC